MAQAPKKTPSIARMMLPATLAAADSIGTDAQRFAAQGDYGRMIGAGLRGVVTYPAALASDVVGRPAMSLARGIGNVAAGVVGSDGSTVVAPAPVPAVVPATPAAAVTQSLAAGRAAEPIITPQDRILAAVDSMLQRPVSLRQLTTAAGVLPQVAQTTPKPRSNADLATGAGMGVADSQYKYDLDAALKIVDEEKRNTAREKATDRYFSRLATVAGRNIAPLTMQDMIAGEQ